MKLNGQKDPEMGEIIEGTSLRTLLDQCNDFKMNSACCKFLGKKLVAQLMQYQSIMQNLPEKR